MRKQKSIGNKGFSLVELIIVIAIMAILIGVMAPQLLRYVERTRVSSDTQLADSVRTAVRTAMMDPVVISDSAATSLIASFNAAATDASSAIDLSGLDTTALGDAIKETLGVDSTSSLATVASNLQSTPATAGSAMTIGVWSNNGNDVGVIIRNSDDGTGSAIVVE